MYKPCKEQNYYPHFKQRLHLYTNVIIHIYIYTENAIIYIYFWSLVLHYTFQYMKNVL